MSRLKSGLLGCALMAGNPGSRGSSSSGSLLSLTTDLGASPVPSTAAGRILPATNSAKAKRVFFVDCETVRPLGSLYLQGGCTPPPARFDPPNVGI